MDVVRNKEFFVETLGRRLGAGWSSAWRYVDRAPEMIVFGSMSVGLDRRDSDIDVLCVGENDYKLKTDGVDLIVISARTADSRAWLGSELAVHVARYGTWIRGVSSWRQDVHLSSRTIEAKEHRVRAFMKYLPAAWSELEECFRVKYATKVRRETQRLILIEQGVPVPPTAILDRFWSTIPRSPDEVYERLGRLAGNTKVDFSDDLLRRVRAHFERKLEAEPELAETS
jgi:hypothetical protein